MSHANEDDRDRYPHDVYSGKFWTFILEHASDPPTLKAFFENIRNYVAGTAVIALGQYGSNKAGLPVAWWVFSVVGGALIFLNLCQSWVLLLRAFHYFIGFRFEELFGTGMAGVVGVLKIGFIVVASLAGAFAATWFVAAVLTSLTP